MTDYDEDELEDTDTDIDCPDCQGTGIGWMGRERCPACHGRGYQLHEPDDDPPEPEPYDGPMPEVEW